MTILKLLDHCYNHGLKATVEYDPTTDSVLLAVTHKKTNRRYTQAVPMSEIKHCSNPELILESVVNNSVDILTGGIKVPEIRKEKASCDVKDVRRRGVR